MKEIREVILLALLVLFSGASTLLAADPTWEYIYEGDILPDDSSLGGNAWQLMGDNMFAEITDQGELHIDDIGVNHSFFLYNFTDAALMQQATIEARVKVLSQSGSANFEVLMGMQDGSNSKWLDLFPDHVLLNNTTTTYDVDMTEYHILRMVRDAADIRIYVDDEEVISEAYVGAGESWIGFIFGAGCTACTSEQYWDYLVFTTDGGFSPEELPSYASMLAGELASNPSPDIEAHDVPRDVSLSWTPGEFAVTHDVYLGTSFADVNTGDSGTLVSQGQAGTEFVPDSVLQFDQTYYWRVDEVNGAPDFTTFKGNVWRFTAEPLSIPISSIMATASSSFAFSVPENTINGAGMVEDLHGTSAPDMWISGSIPATIEYGFDRAYKLHELWIWNSNQLIEAFVGFGAKDVVIEHSLDGENWTVLEGVGPLAQAPGREGYAHNNTIRFGGITAQYVRITVNSVQGIAPQASLSEVRFLSIPTLARRPSPDSGAVDVAADVVLSWGRDGREADRHEIYLGADPNSLPLVDSVTESSFDTLALDLQLGETYSWRVNEVNETEDPSIWTGDIWRFTTVDTIIVDDMESYRDEEFFEIWATWVDGFGDAANGSLVGNGVTGSPESGIVQGGGKSLPLHYDNGAAPQSEATRTFAAAQDWSKHGVQGLVLFFHGSVDNTGGRLTLKINGTQVVYDGDPADLQRIGWHKWYIDLAALPAATRGSVNSLTIGIDSGGAGVVIIDDILLTPEARELITPAELGSQGLVAYYPFDGDFQDASGNGLHGTGMGGALGVPIFEPGQSGQAISLDGAGQYVEITGYQGISAVDGVQQPFSISNWFATMGDGEMVTWGSTPGGQRLSWRIDVGNLRTEHGNGNLRGNTLVNDEEWHHAALVVQEGANLRVPNTTLYIDGLADGVNSGDDDLYNLTPSVDVSIGRRATSNDRFFPGSIDEVRIFDRALSAGEVAGLAGRTQAFDKP